MGKYNHFKPKNIVNCNSVTVELPMNSLDLVNKIGVSIRVYREITSFSRDDMYQ